MTDYSALNLTSNPTLGSIVKLIGQSNANKLTYSLGGKCLYIPYKVRTNHPLAVAVGLDEAKKICKTWGGMEYHIPFDEAKTLKAQALRDKGRSVQEIAKELTMTERHVYRLFEKKQTDKSQLNLF